MTFCNITIHNEDCFKNFSIYKDNEFDLTITDPPYNVNYDEWDSIEDYPAYCKHWFENTLRISKVLAFTPGIANIWMYPKADWVLCWAKPASARRNITGGFNHFEPVLVYGLLENKIKIWKDYINLPPSANRAPSWMTHPCPKPVNLYYWIIDIMTEEGSTIFDPYSGSGTAAIACIKHNNRHFVGYERDITYYNESVKRVEEAQQQITLF